MYKKIREFNDVLIKKALELNGTITGEHVVGLHKKEYLLEEHGDNIPVMKMIKRSIDQNNIMNPGKIFDLNLGYVFHILTHIFPSHSLNSCLAFTFFSL